MATDLTELQSAGVTKVVGSNATGVEGTPVSSSGTGDLHSADVLKSGGLHATLVVGTTPVELKVGVSRLPNRKLVTLDNTSNATLYWGYSNAITTTSNAGRIFKDSQASWKVSDAVTIFIIAGTAANSTQISEGA